MHILRTSIFIGLLVYNIFARPDQIWLYSDTLCPYKISFCDTSDKVDHCWTEDSSGSFDSSNCFSFPYKFTTDSLYYVNEIDSLDTLYRDCRPGFAGFQMYWEWEMVSFPVYSKDYYYKYLILKHRGPLQHHKVSIWGKCDGISGATYYAPKRQYIGSISASDNWKTDTVSFPDIFRNNSDTINSINCYSLEFHITNKDSSSPMESDSGMFQIDDIQLAGITKLEIKESNTNKGVCGSGAALAFIPPVWYKVIQNRRRKKNKYLN